MPEISVIIPTCSEKVPLLECLRSLGDQSLARSRYDILLVNNGSEQHARSFIEPTLSEWGGEARVIQAPKNLGYPGGCRLGAEHSSGEFLFFHNDDAIADPAWLALALAEFRRVSDLGALSCRIVDASGPRVQHEGVKQILPNGLFWQTGWGEPDIPSGPPRMEDPDFFSGCVWATRRSLWDEIGGLGEAYRPGYYEDMEYGLRCRQLGYRIRILRQVTCSHYGSLTLGGTSAAYWVAFHRSRFLYLLRNRTDHSKREILRAEIEWLLRHGGDGRPAACLLGFLTAIPRIPAALADRGAFRRKQLASL